LSGDLLRNWSVQLAGPAGLDVLGNPAAARQVEGQQPELMGKSLYRTPKDLQNSCQKSFENGGLSLYLLV
jgi:hypothetical protein